MTLSIHRSKARCWPKANYSCWPHGWLKPKQKYIALQDLAGQSLIGLEGHDPLSRLLDAKLQALRPLPVVQTRVQTYPMMRGLVEAGEGLAIVDPFTAFGAQESGWIPARFTAHSGQPIRTDVEECRVHTRAECAAGNRRAKAQPLLAGSPAL